MAKDTTVQTQKVTVALKDFVTVLNEYNRARQASNAMAHTLARSNNTVAEYQNAQIRRIAFEWVLDTLQLPREGK